MRHLLYIIPTLFALWMLDNGISLDRYAGWERNAVRNSMARWDQQKRAKVAIFGSSTSKDWLPRPFLAKVTGVRTGDVLDAHVNGCHQGCTWASVRTLLRRERHFDTVFFGTNLFQMCEQVHSKRVLQHQIMTPAADAPRLFGLYAHAQQPLTYVGRYVGMTFSGAYGDTAAVQRWLAEDLYGKPRRGRGHLWARKRIPRKSKTASCRYRDADVAYKAAVSAALFDDLSALADEVFVMLLPDPTASSDDPEDQRRWAAHRALHQRLADARPQVTLIDLVTDGVVEPKGFRDAIHLHRDAMPRQQALFEARMKALGWPRAKGGKSKGAKRAPAPPAVRRAVKSKASAPPRAPSDMPAKPSDMPAKPSGMPAKSSGMPSQPSETLIEPLPHAPSGIRVRPLGTPRAPADAAGERR